MFNFTKRRIYLSVLLFFVICVWFLGISKVSATTRYTDDFINDDFWDLNWDSQLNNYLKEVFYQSWNFRINEPQDITVDNNNLFVTDWWNNRIVKLNKDDLEYIDEVTIRWVSAISSISVDDNFLYVDTTSWTLPNPWYFGIIKLKKSNLEVVDRYTDMTDTWATLVSYWSDIDSQFYYILRENALELYRKIDLSFVSRFGEIKTPGSWLLLLDHPQWVAVWDDYIFISDDENNRLVLLNKNDLSYNSEITGYNATWFNDIWDLYIDIDNNNLYLADLTNDVIVKFDINNDILTYDAEIPSAYNFIYWDSDSLYVAWDWNDIMLAKINKSTKNITLSVNQRNEESVYLVDDTKESFCAWGGGMSVEVLNPWDAIPSILTGRTIYLLNSGTYSINHTINFSECSSIVWKWIVKISADSSISTDGILRFDNVRYWLIENIILDGWAGHETIHWWILISWSSSFGNIIDNTLVYNFSEWLHINNSWYNNIINNTRITATDKAIWLWNTENNIFTNVQSFNNTSYWFRLEYANKNTIANSIIYSNWTHGISIRESNSNIFDNLDIYKNSSDWISFTENSDNNLLHNIKSYNNNNTISTNGSTGNYYYDVFASFGNLDSNDILGTGLSVGTWNVSLWRWSGMTISYDLWWQFITNPKNNSNNYLFSNWSINPWNVTWSVFSPINYIYGKNIWNQKAVAVRSWNILTWREVWYNKYNKIGWNWYKIFSPNIDYSVTDWTTWDVNITFTWDFELISWSLPDISFTWNETRYIEYEDIYGNTGSISVDVSWIDRDSSSWMIKLDNIDYPYSNPNIYWTNWSGVTGVLLYNVFDWDSPIHLLTGTDAIHYFSWESETYIYWLEDDAGNVRTWLVTALIDRTMPSGWVDYNTGWTNQDVTVYAYQIDAVTGEAPLVSIYVSDPYSQWDSITITDFWWTYWFKLEDIAWNVRYITWVVTNIDKSAPTWNIIIDPVWYTSGTVIVTLTWYSWITWDESAVYVSGSQEKSFVDENSYYSFELWDDAGNVTYYTGVLTGIDTTAPGWIISYNTTSWTSWDVIVTFTWYHDWWSEVSFISGTTDVVVVTWNNTPVTFILSDEVWYVYDTWVTINWIDKTVPSGTIWYFPTWRTNTTVSMWITWYQDSWSEVIALWGDEKTIHNNWLYTFILKDEVWYESYFSQNITGIDTTMPTWSIVYSTNNWTSWNILVEITWYSDSWSPVFVVPSSWKILFTAEWQTWVFNLDDSAWNYNNIFIPAVKIDKTAPAVMIVDYETNNVRPIITGIYADVSWISEMIMEISWTDINYFTSVQIINISNNVFDYTVSENILIPGGDEIKHFVISIVTKDLAWNIWFASWNLTINTEIPFAWFNSLTTKVRSPSISWNSEIWADVYVTVSGVRYATTNYWEYWAIDSGLIDSLNDWFYDIMVEIIDNLWNTWTNIFTNNNWLIIDNTWPVLSVNNNIIITKDNTPLVTWSYVDLLAGIMNTGWFLLTIDWWDIYYPTNVGTGYSWNWQITLPELDDWVHNIIITGVDALWNTNNVSLSITVDTILPYINYDVIYTSNLTPTIYWSILDTGSDIFSVSVSIDWTWYVVSGTNNWSVDILTWFSLWYHDLFITSSDEAWNIWMLNIINWLWIGEDNIEFSGVMDSWFYNTTRYIYFDTWLSVVLNWDNYNSWTPVIAEWNYNLTISNTSWLNISIWFVIDKTDPIYSWVENWWFYSWDVVIAFGDDNISWAKLNNINYSGWTIINNTGEYSFVVEDLAWNQTWVNFVIDKQAPTYDWVVSGVVYTSAITITYQDNYTAYAKLNWNLFNNWSMVWWSGISILEIWDDAWNRTFVTFDMQIEWPSAILTQLPDVNTNLNNFTWITVWWYDITMYAYDLVEWTWCENIIYSPEINKNITITERPEYDWMWTYCVIWQNSSWELQSTWNVSSFSFLYDTKQPMWYVNYSTTGNTTGVVVVSGFVNQDTWSDVTISWSNTIVFTWNGVFTFNLRDAAWNINILDGVVDNISVRPNSGSFYNDLLNGWYEVWTWAYTWSLVGKNNIDLWATSGGLLSDVVLESVNGLDGGKVYVLFNSWTKIYGSWGSAYFWIFDSPIILDEGSVSWQISNFDPDVMFNVWAEDGLTMWTSVVIRIYVSDSFNVWDSLDMYYSVDWISRRLHSYAIVEIENWDKFIEVETDHFTYFAIWKDTTVTTYTNNNTNSSSNDDDDSAWGRKLDKLRSTKSKSQRSINVDKDDCVVDNSPSYYDGTCEWDDDANKKDDVSKLLAWMFSKFASWSDQKYKKVGSIENSPYSEELNDAYLYAYNLGITTMSTIQRANMKWNLVRIDLAKMISEYSENVLWKKPNIYRRCYFNDIWSESMELQAFAKKACQLWLMWLNSDWTPATSFNPHTVVNRATFGTAFSRAIFGNRYNWNNYNRYINHLKALKNKNIMKYIEQPFNAELRWLVMLMMMRADND